jgi:hypothetical protein
MGDNSPVCASPPGATMVKRALLRLAIALAGGLAAAVSMAGTLVLKSPTEDSFLGLNNNIQFSITGARVKVTVTATVTGPSGVTRIPQEFTPDGEGKIDGSIAVNFSQGTPTGEYTIRLSATEPGNVYDDQTVTVRVDVQRPKFFSYSPYNGAFVKGLVRIRATVLEENIKDWRVKVNGQDIPNNTGTTNSVMVDWDASLIERDGPNTVDVVVRDQANNESTLSIPVVLDRIKPSVTIAYPRSDTRILPHTNVNVTIDVVDASTNSVDASGIDVVVRKLDGTYVTRVARISLSPSGGNTLRWIGRIRYGSGLIPSQFKIVATAIDRAGNVAATQEVTLKGR